MSHILYILFIFRCASLYFNLLVAHCEWSSESLFSRSRIGASLSRFLCYIKSLGLKSSGVQNKLSPFEYKWKRILSQLEDVGVFHNPNFWSFFFQNIDFHWNCPELEQNLFWTKLQQQVWFGNTTLLARMAIGDKFWVGIFTRQGYISQVSTI